MTSTADSQPDLEKQEDVKADRTRRLLKWAIVLSVIALLAIVGVAIPMALKVLPENAPADETSTSVASGKDPAGDFDNKRPVPTPAPTVEPGSPTATPTVATSAPTNKPSKSAAPTDDMPSASPTAFPTPSPSRNPTNSPTPLESAAPTTSPAPTVAPIDPNYSFKLRLFWQRGFYWQESFQEVWHCVECTRCNEYGAGDGWEHGCEEYENGDASYCQEGDMFWIMGCLDGQGARFNVLENPGSGHQIRLAGTNLCMGRGAPDADTGEWKRRLMQAVKCNSDDPDQLWAPFRSLSKFELRPLEHAGRSEEDAECVSQLHHPKNEEVISMHGCKLSRIYETRYWEEYD